jgi:hypothetical protein
MFKRNLTKITVVSLLAAMMGVTAGRFYAGAIANTANAESGVAETVPNAPTWQDLHVLYFGPADNKVANEEFNPSNFASEVNAQIAANADEVMKYSQTKGLDVLIFDKQVLAALDPSWAAAQYRRGTAFVGLNVTSQELGKLIDDPWFTEQFNYPPYPTPFLSQAMIRIEGNPDHIRQLDDLGALYPPTEKNTVMKIELGINDVNIGWFHAYLGLPQEGLVRILNDIPADSVGKEPVAPYQP